MTCLRLRVATAALGIPALIAALYYGGLFWALALLVIAVAGSLGARGPRSSGIKRGTGRAPVGKLAACALELSAYTPTRDDISGAASSPSFGRPRARSLVWSTLVASLPANGSLRYLAAAIYPGLFLTASSCSGGRIPRGVPCFARHVGDRHLRIRRWFPVGRTPIWPSVSPKKTVEGALGGLTGGVAAGAVLGNLVADGGVAWASVGLVASVAAQVGDSSSHASSV